MVRKKRDTSAKQNDLMEAALATFEEVGFDAATMAQIANKAGASKKTLYNHFGSKENLLTLIIEKCITSSVQQLKCCEYDPTQSLKAQLLKFVDYRAESIIAPGKARIARILFEVYARNKSTCDSVASNYENEQGVFMKWLEDAEKDGKLNIKDREIACRLFWSNINGAITYPYVFNMEPPTGKLDQLKNEIVDMYLDHYEA